MPKKYISISMACLYGHSKCLETILDLGDVDVDILNEDDNTMSTGLMIACKRGNVKCVELLLDRNANIEKTDKYGKTPLHYSCMRDNNQHVVKVLLNRGSLPNACDHNGTTPLMYCAQYTDTVEMCELLIQYGAVIDYHDNTKINACMYASKHNNKNVLSKIREVCDFLFCRLSDH